MPPEYVTLMLNMAEEIATKKQESADKRERKEKLNKQMVNFEGMIATAAHAAVHSNSSYY